MKRMTNSICMYARGALALAFALLYVSARINDPSGDAFVIYMSTLLIFILLLPIALGVCFVDSIRVVVNATTDAVLGLRLALYSYLASVTPLSHMSVANDGFVKINGISASLSNRPGLGLDDSTIWQEMIVEKLSLFGMRSDVLYEDEWSSPFLLESGNESLLVMPLDGMFYARKKRVYSGAASLCTIPIPKDSKDVINGDANVRVTKEYIVLGESLCVFGEIKSIDARSGDVDDGGDNKVARDFIIQLVKNHFGDSVSTHVIQEFDSSLRNYISRIEGASMTDGMLRILIPSKIIGNKLLLSSVNEGEVIWSLFRSAIISIAVMVIVILIFLYL